VRNFIAHVIAASTAAQCYTFPKLYRDRPVMTTLLILFIGLTPSLFSLWLMRQVDARGQARLRLAIDSVAARGLPTLQLQPEQHYVEGMGYVIGDITCRFNARSHLIRCAPNPFGPCQGCSQYQPQPIED
jgi:hypothetical protein